MISFVRGTVATAGADLVVVDLGSVGLTVSCTPGTALGLRHGDHVELMTSMVVREDGWTLYGFTSADERTVFEHVQTVSGIGPRIAMALLATLSPDELRRAVSASDETALMARPGHRAQGGAAADPGARRPPRTGDGGARGRPRTLRRAGGTAGSRPWLPGLTSLGWSAREADAAVVGHRPGARGHRHRGGRRRRHRLPAQGRPARAGPLVTLSAESDPDDAVVEGALRPTSLAEFIGQERVKSQLGLVLEAANRRGRAADHVLLSGPPGLGKTTLASIIATELGRPLRMTAGPALQHAGDVAAVLSSLQPGEVLFIDEVHRTARAAEELLYLAMEDFRIDVVVGKGPGATAIPVDIEPFTLVGATTRAGLLPSPLRDRFGFTAHLDFYDAADLEVIIERSAGLLSVPVDRDGRGRDRRPLSRHPAHRQPPPAPGARLGADPRGRRRQSAQRPGRAGAVRGRRPRAWTASTRPSSTRSSTGSAAVRSGLSHARRGRR